MSARCTHRRRRSRSRLCIAQLAFLSNSWFSVSTQLFPMPSPDAKVPKSLQRTPSRVAVDAARNAGASSVALTSQDPPQAASSPRPVAAQRTNVQRDRLLRSPRGTPNNAQRVPARVQRPSPMSARTPSVATSPAAGTALSTPQQVKSYRRKSLAYSPSRSPLDSPATGPTAAEEVTELTQHDGKRGVPGCPSVGPIQQAKDRPGSASPTPSPRVLSSQVPHPKSGTDSMRPLSDLLLDAGKERPSSSLSTTPRASSVPKPKWLLEAQLTAIVLVGFALLAFVTFLFRVPGRQIGEHCLTKSCTYHRDLIESQLNRNVDPCHNFAAHVCGRWRPHAEFSDLSKSALTNMEMAWLSKLRDTLLMSADQLPVQRKAAAMFNVCMAQTGSQVGVLKDFMREHGIAWPEDPGDKLQSLQVLFDLSFNWNVNLWFSLKLLPTAADDLQKRRILFAPNDVMLFWRSVFRQIRRKHFAKVYTSMFKLFTNDTGAEPPPQRIEEAYNNLQYVFDTLIRSSTGKPIVPAMFPLRELDSHSDVASAKHVKRAIDTMLAIEPPFTMEDLLLFSDIGLLKGVLKIFRTVRDHAMDRAVHRHLAWLFLIAYGAVANPEGVLLILHGDTWRAQKERFRFCAAQVEASYTLLVSSAAAVAHFSEEERRRIDSHLASIVEMAAQKSLTASWLDNRTQHVAADKLRKMRTVLWPAREFLTAQGLEEAYVNFTDNASSFAHYWIETRRSKRDLVGSDAGLQELRIRAGFVQPYIDYVHVLNQLSLSQAALAPPLYYKDGTKAMLYGGLGYYYAKELVGALDTEGVQVDQHGNIVSSWLSDSVKPVFAERVLGCLPSADVSVFPEVPAMEVAFGAFERAHDEEDAQLSEELTEVKVFFITACLFSCAKTADDNLYGGDCNKAMTNFAPFAQTFRCPLGSNMNPRKKCPFFG